MDMRAAVIERAGRASVATVPAPPPGDGEVRIRVEGCGVCGSDLGSWLGNPWARYPLPPGAPGHEGWGRVEALGPGIDGAVDVDGRVAFLSSRAYAEYAVAKVSEIVPLPPALDGRPFPAESLGCAMNVFRRSEIRPGQTAAVIGAGFLGLLLVQLAARDGARVIAISRRPFACGMALAHGAEVALAIEDRARVASEVLGMTSGNGCERVIEVAGVQASLDLATDIVRERGRLVIAGYHQDGSRTVNMQAWNWRGIDVINAHERAPDAYVDGMRRAVRAVSTGELDPWSLFTHRFSLEQVDAALDSVHQRPDGFLKAVISP